MAPKGVKRRAVAEKEEPDDAKAGGKRGDEGTESAEVRRGPGSQPWHASHPCRKAHPAPFPRPSSGGCSRRTRAQVGAQGV
jgi:hypothetical protein